MTSLPMLNDLWLALLAAAPTRPQVLADKVNYLLRRSCLRERDRDAVWDLLWEKPLYAFAMANVAEPAVTAIRLNGCFRDPAAVLDASWEVVRVPGQNFQAVGENAVRWRQGLLPGSGDTVQFHGAPIALARLFAIRELGFRYAQGLGDSLQEACAQQLLAPLDAGVWQQTRDAIFPLPPHAPAAGLLGPRIAITTAQHMALDLGFSTLKPDRWFLGFYAAATGIPFHRNAAVDRRRLITLETWLAGLVQELEISEDGLPQLDIQLVRQAPFRFADLVIAKFGMNADPSWGIERAPRNLPPAAVPQSLHVLQTAFD